MDPTDQGLRVVWREKSFGQRLGFGACGGKSVPLGPRTIFLGRPKRRLHLLIIRKNLNYVSEACRVLSQSGKDPNISVSYY